MAKQKYAQTETTILDWAEKHDGVRVWLSKLHGTKEQRALSLWYYCDWAEKTPKELLELKNSFESLDAEKLLDKFVLDADYPDSLKWKSALAVRSFYRCNYRQLQREAGKMDYYQVKPQRNPSKLKRLELYNACYNPRDRALICVTTCSAIALETLSSLCWNHFEENWQAQDVPHISIPSELLKGHGKGKYRGVRQETFVTPETKRELIKYRDFMTKRHGVIWTEDMYVFLSNEQNKEKKHEPLKYQAVGNAILRISKEAHVGFGAHDGRRIVETALENVGTPRNWIQKIKGRKVRGEDAPYSKPAIEQLRKKYREALPELEFLNVASVSQTSELQELKEKVAKIEGSRTALEALLLRVEKLENKLDKK
jgi:hypothetical protein